MIISVVGNFYDIEDKIKKTFTFKPCKVPQQKKVEEPVRKKNVNILKKKDFPISYLGLGYKTVGIGHLDVYPLKIIETYLGSGQSCKLFDELRNKDGLVYTFDVSSTYVHDIGDFSAFATGNKKDIPKIKEIFLKEILNVRNITKSELVQVKKKIILGYIVVMVNKMHKAKSLIAEELMKADYIKQIKAVTLADLKRVIDEYFKFYTCVVVEKK